MQNLYNHVKWNESKENSFDSFINYLKRFNCTLSYDLKYTITIAEDVLIANGKLCMCASVTYSL